MQSNEYYESIQINEDTNFIVSYGVDESFQGRVHWHPYVEILISLSDENTASVNFEKYALRRNDILVIYPGDLHATHVSGEGAMAVIQFSYELLTVIKALGRNIPLLSQRSYLKYDARQPGCEQMIMLMKQFCDAYEAQSDFREVYMYSILLRFFQLLGDRNAQMQTEHVKKTISAKTRTIKKMADACLYISKNCEKPLSQENVADHLGVSKSYFAHLFKEYTGITFVDYLTRERIRRAQSLFQNPEFRVTDVAYESGFSSISSFNRTFKKLTGLSPSQYRQTMVK